MNFYATNFIKLWTLNVLQVRFDFEVFELNSDGSGGSCTYDSMAILDSPESPGKVIIKKSRGEGSLMDQDTIENVS